jgi:drug/metabolite transporter (DMT)-like permease
MIWLDSLPVKRVHGFGFLATALLPSVPERSIMARRLAGVEPGHERVTWCKLEICTAQRVGERLESLMNSEGSPRGRYLDFVLLLALGAAWGASYLFIKVGIGEIPPFTFVALRLLLGAIIMLVLLRVLGHPVPRTWRQWRGFAVMGFLSGAVPWSLISWGEQYISSGLAALLQATMPIFTVIMAHFAVRDESMTPTKVLGVVVGFVGVGVLMLPELRQGVQASLLGQLAIVGSSASYAAGAIYARRELRGQSPLVSTMGQLATGAIMMVPISLLVDRPFDLAPSWPALGSLLALTVLGTVVAYVIYYALIERTSATFVSTVTYIIPVNGLLLGALVLGEPLDMVLWVSLGLILLGVLLVRK